MLVDTVSVALRALSFVALFQAAGTAIFIAVFGRELARTAHTQHRVATLAALTATAAVLAHYALEAARMAGEWSGVLDPTLQSVVLHSNSSLAAAWRVAGLALILIGVRKPHASGVVLSLLGVTVSIASFAFVGHTADHPERWALTLLLLTHLLVVSFWFGALLPLYFVSRREARASAAGIIEAFSRAAIYLVPGLFLAGLVLAAVLLRDPAGLRTAYGQLLIAKVTGFALLMVLASLNKWRLGPAIAKGEARADLTFQRSVLAEYVLIVAILATTAALTSFFSPEP